MINKKIDEIFWALPPGSKRNTRPARLVAELISLGIVEQAYSAYFHGKALSDLRETTLGRFLPYLPTKGSDQSRRACFSPVFIRNLARGHFLWVDLYDDWSLAPDINYFNRLVAGRFYERVRSNDNAQLIVTCNSPYMAGKLGLSKEYVVPNGVDHSLATLAKLGNDQRRLVLFGHFFRGRTDFELIRTVCAAGQFDEILIGAPGSDPEMEKIIRELGSTSAKVTVEPWISDAQIMEKVGSRTVCLIPNLVNDYTLSQDLMKCYQMLALGIPIVVPRILLPAHLPIDLCFLWDFGVSTDNLSQWIDYVSQVKWDRGAFAAQNSWQSRAGYIAELVRNHEAR